MKPQAAAAVLPHSSAYSAGRARRSAGASPPPEEF
jgi:hypothetical protein